MADIKIGIGIVKELLEFYSKIDDEIEIYRTHIKHYEDIYYNNLEAVFNDGQPRGKNHISKPTEEAAINVPEYARDTIRTMQSRMKELQSLKNQLLQEVSRLKLKEKSIIFDRYIYNLRWTDIAEKNSYSEKQCRNIRNMAVQQLVFRFQKNDVIVQYVNKNPLL